MPSFASYLVSGWYSNMSAANPCNFCNSARASWFGGKYSEARRRQISVARSYRSKPFGSFS
eukprot:6012060-Alexandrium_andersonii.AAC.1